MAPTIHTPLPGFADPVFDSQSTFRVILDALSRPGGIFKMPCEAPAPKGLAPASAAICLTLLDHETSVWLDAPLDNPEVQSFLQFHTGCALADDPGEAYLAILSVGTLPACIEAFGSGSSEYPDRSTTIIAQTGDLREEPGVRLSGPGIETERWLEVGGAAPAFWISIAANNARFPLGVDFLFVAENRIAGLPRSTQVEV